MALPPGSATAVTAGWDNSCALMVGGTMDCWGFNNHGQLGDGTTTNRSSPTPVPGLSNVTAITAGGYHTCALLADTTVRCWGEGDFDELGDGTGTDQSTPVAVAGLTGAVSVSAGRNTTCARTSTGEVLLCWGNNDFGQLGDGTTASRPTPVVIGSSYASVAAGGDHTCEITTGGDVDCQGDNSLGQLGFASPEGSPPSSDSPTQVDGGFEQDEVIAGDQFSCSQAADEIRCWGDNTYGQLGRYFTGGTFPEPGGIFGVSAAFDSLSGIYRHACAVTSGQVMCWGANDFGQLGDGTFADNGAPQVVRFAPLVSS
jgi:alpha-tubulin suppressor-like RCC1 family protein